MIPREILKDVRRIQIRTSHMVDAAMAGQYESVFRGTGMEFHEVREYQQGDDVRAIDWNVTARTGRPFVKRFVEERELTVMLVVDLSGSGKFGSQRSLKNQIAAELTALLAYSAIKNNDRVGLIIFTDHVEKVVPPKKGRRHVLRLIREVLYYKPTGKGTRLLAALEYLGRVTKRRAVVFLISDFFDTGFEHSLRVVSKRHDLIGLIISDPREKQLPKLGLIEMQDPETGESLLLDTSDRRTREIFEEKIRHWEKALEDIFRKAAVDRIRINTDASYVEPLVKFFRMREKRLAR